MQSNLVSVIMPAYNAEKYIAESIESVLAQTYEQWELLIIDDGSADRTKAIAESYAVRDERIQYIFQLNGKQGRARNKGIAAAHGEMIAFLDADDIWLPSKLEVQVAEMKEKGADLVFADTCSINEEGKMLQPSWHVCEGIYAGASGLQDFFVIIKFLYSPCSCAGNRLWR